MLTKQPTLVVCLAAPEDMAWLVQWERHLLPLQQAGYINIWSERQVLGGEDLLQQMNRQVDQADFIVLLLSADFFASDTCIYLMERACMRQRNEQVTLVPLLLRPSTWQDSPLGILACLPSQGQAITSWNNVDEAFQVCVEGIRQLLGLPLKESGPSNYRFPLLVRQQVSTNQLKIDTNYVFGVDIDGSHTTARLTNLMNEEVAYEWSGLFDTKPDWQVGSQFVVDILNDLMHRAHVPRNQILGVGLGVPGTYPTLYGWNNIDIPNFLKRKLKLRKNTPILLDNRATMAAFGESRYGAGYGTSNLIYVSIGSNIDIGLILNGQRYRGAKGIAGEFGHVLLIQQDSLQQSAPSCPFCGRKGCLEMLVVAPVIVKDAQKGTSLTTVFSSNGVSISTNPPLLAGRADVDIADVILAAQNGDLSSRAALQRAGERIGAMLGLLVDTYNPEIILLGGPAVYSNEILISAIVQSAKASSLPMAWPGTTIEIGQLGNDAVIQGAVAAVIDSVFSREPG